MTFDFKPLAVAFVNRRQCATTVPVELVMAAMEEGAAEALKQSTERLRKVRDDLKSARERNIGR